MEGVWTGLGPNARVVCEIELKVQKLPCFARGMCFDVQECLRDECLVFLAQGNVKNLFGIVTKLGYNRYSSYVILASWLVLKEKCEVKWGRPVQAISKHAQVSCTFAWVCGTCLLQRKKSKAQEIQNCKKYALWKRYYYLYAINGLIQCVMNIFRAADHQPKPHFHKKFDLLG